MRRSFIQNMKNRKHILRKLIEGDTVYTYKKWYRNTVGSSDEK